MLSSNIFQSSEADIINNKKAGRIYVADFGNGEGRYIDISEYSSEIDEIPDIDVKISPRINLRITYLTSKDEINGVQISKVNGDKVESIHFSTLDSHKISYIPF